MKHVLATALALSLLLNASLLLERRRAAPSPTIVRTKIVERTSPAPDPSPGPVLPRPEVRGSDPAPAPPAVAPAVTLLASPTYATPEGDVTVTLTVLSGKASAREWIGMFAAGADASRYVAYQMVTASSTYAFKAPRDPGEYEFRYVLADERTAIASSNPFRVIGDPVPRLQVDLRVPSLTLRCGEPLPVRWTLLAGRRSSRDWIGLFAPGAKNQDFLTWKYVPDQDRGGLDLKAPDQPGVYEVRYLLDDGFEAAATGERLVVVP